MSDKSNFRYFHTRVFTSIVRTQNGGAVKHNAEAMKEQGGIYPRAGHRVVHRPVPASTASSAREESKEREQSQGVTAAAARGPELHLPLRTEKMRNQSWLRKNWIWVAGGAFSGIHFSTWLLQKAMKSSVRTEQQIKSKTPSEE
ncbi:hypothetical protein F2P79_007989 [Pimephales promelas]|nr:hypothetical protein F2P79_007989 [Pimephales promelas]